MTEKYHIKKDGIPGSCKASSNNCPLASDNEHYATLQSALAAATERLEKNFPTISTKTKDNTIYHISQTGEAEECVYRTGMCNVVPFKKYGNYHSSNISEVEPAAENMRLLVANEELRARKVITRKQEEDKITAQARQTLVSTPRLHKIERGDTITARKKADERRDSCSGRVYGESKNFNTLREALEAGYTKDEITVRTMSSCHHSTSIPDFSEENLDIDSRSQWELNRAAASVLPPQRRDNRSKSDDSYPYRSNL